MDARTQAFDLLAALGTKKSTRVRASRLRRWQRATCCPPRTPKAPAILHLRVVSDGLLGVQPLGVGRVPRLHALLLAKPPALLGQLVLRVPRLLVEPVFGRSRNVAHHPRETQAEGASASDNSNNNKKPFRAAELERQPPMQAGTHGHVGSKVHCCSLCQYCTAMIPEQCRVCECVCARYNSTIRPETQSHM